MSPEEWLAKQENQGAESPEKWLARQKETKEKQVPALFKSTAGGAAIGFKSPLRGVVDPDNQAARIKEVNDLFARDPSKAGFSGLGAYGASMAKGAAAGGSLGATIGLFTGGPVGAAGGLGAGAISGGISGIATQAARDLGFGEGTQTIAGMVTPGYGLATSTGQKIISKLPENLGEKILEITPYIGGVYSKAKILSQMKKEESLANQAKAQITGSMATQGRQAEQAVGESAARGLSSATGQIESYAQKRAADIEARTQQELKQKQKTLAELKGQKQGAATAEERAASEAAAQQTGIKTVPPSEFGSSIQTELLAKKEELEKLRSDEAAVLHKAYYDFARSKQVAGHPWQSSDLGKEAIRKLEGMLKPSNDMGVVRARTTDEEKTIQTVIDELKGKRTVKVEHPYPETRTEEHPLDIEGIDHVIRKINEASKGQPAEGYAAIGENLAKDLKKTITDSLYEWAPKGSIAKLAYAERSEKLNPFVESQISSVTKLGEKVTSQLKTNALDVGKSVFKSADSVKDFKAALGNDKKVSEFARTYVNNKLSEIGGNIKKTEAFLNDANTKEWMKEAGIKGHGKDYLDKLKHLSSVEHRAAQGQKQIVSNIEGIEKQQQKISTAGKSQREEVYKTASAKVKELSTIANRGKIENERFDSLLSKGNPKEVETFGKLLDEKGRSAVPDAVRAYLSRQSMRTIGDKYETTRPLLKTLMDSKQISELDAVVEKAKSQFVTENNPTQKELNRASAVIGARIAGILATERK